MNINEIFKPVLIPTDFMSVEEKLNTLIRLILFICFIVALILSDWRIILFGLIILIFYKIIYDYHIIKKEEKEKYLNDNNLDIIDNKTCTKPIKNNPFMNPNITDIKYKEIDGACSITNEKITSSIENIFNSDIYRNVDDIYDKNTSFRQWYTVPSTKIPNEQKIFAEWLYGRDKTCKENNGYQCFKNKY